MLLGYAMDQSMKIKDATGKIGHADHVRGLRHQPRFLRHHRAHSDTLKEKPDLVRRFMAATTKAIEARGEGARRGDVKAVLKALPKAGKPETLQEGFELTIPLYRTEETKGQRPFNVSDANMAETVNLLIEYGGVDPAAKNDPKQFYSREFLPKATQ